MKEYNFLMKAIICVVIGIILIPLLINLGVLLCNFIPSAGTNGDWFSFYGSFLGGVIGGSITLVGIYISIKSINKNVKPLVIPLSTTFFAYVNSDSISISNEKFNSEDEIHYEPAIYILIKAINVGSETAINLMITWNLQDNKYTKIYLSNGL